MYMYASADTAVYSDETLTLHNTFIKKCTFSLPHYVEHLSVLPGKMAIGVLPQSRELVTVNLPQNDSEVHSCVLGTMEEGRLTFSFLCCAGYKY